VEASSAASPESLLALADVADGIGRSVARDHPEQSLSWFRDAAVYSWFAVQATESPVRARAIERHNESVERLLCCAGTGGPNSDPSWRARLASAGIEVATTMPDRATVPYHELWIASNFKVKHLEHIGQCGLGVPLITLSCLLHREAIPERFLPERLRMPATGVIHAGGPLEGGAWRSRPVVLALHDPARETSVAFGPSAPEVPLAADLTTPMAHQFIESPLTQIAWGGLLRPESYESVPGIFMSGPYQRGKIPVLFIHGLWSSPDAWLRMANALQADPLLRERYQFWYAYYPTGAPLLVSAARIRQELHELRDAIDPGRSDPALDQMVVVGHSLGGVLTKQMLQASGRTVERGLFTRPIEDVEMSPESRAALSELIYFEPEASISRAVFIAAPHRGSNTANRVIGRVATTLVRRPGAVAAIHSEIVELNGRDVFQPFFRRRPPTSIDNLEWESPILQALERMPVAPGVPYHSIVANLLPSAPSALWTDGVVSYESAHIHGAESEVMIRHDHFANDTIEATAEVRRILRQHVGALD
jgi:pimeloyl-ACP methyl ester carboxylesterase